jgi:hypothetical protein
VTQRLRRPLLLCLIVVCAAVVGLPSYPAAQSGYALVSLGDQGGGAATDVNDSGQVVGYLAGRSGAYVWTPVAGLQPLGNDLALADLFPSFDVFPKPLGIGPTGIVVGNGRQAAGSAVTGAAKWSPAVGYEFGGGGEGVARARAINRSGTAVGLYRGNSAVPLLWSPGQPPEILPGFLPSAGGSDAFDINDSGSAVGRCSGMSSCPYGSLALIRFGGRFSYAA